MARKHLLVVVVVLSILTFILILFTAHMAGQDELWSFQTPTIAP